MAVILTGLCLISTSNAALSPGPATIDITIKVRETVFRHDAIIITSSLYNKRITPRSIGNSVAACRNVANKRTLPKGTYFCNTVYRFPLGQIIVAGIVSSPVYSRMAVVGGTGIYSNVGGQVILHAFNLNPLRARLHFALEAF